MRIVQVHSIRGSHRPIAHCPHEHFHPSVISVLQVDAQHFVEQTTIRDDSGEGHPFKSIVRRRSMKRGISCLGETGDCCYMGRLLQRSMCQGGTQEGRLTNINIIAYI